jgi:hypothetical protein
MGTTLRLAKTSKTIKVTDGLIIGNTPLHLACEKPNLEIMLFLLMQGSDYSIKNAKGYKAGENTLDARM